MTAKAKILNHYHTHPELWVPPGSEDWDAAGAGPIRDLTREAGIEWDFESWPETVRLVRAGRGQWGGPAGNEGNL